MTVWQAFIDDSHTPNGTFVLGGYIATAEAWANFSKEWGALLPFGTLAKNDKYHFKMSEMASNPERMKRVPAFYRVIERHVEMAVSCAFNVGDLERARARVWVKDLNIDWGFFANRYLTATRCLLDMFHTHRAKIDKIIPAEEKIDFIFDEQSEKSVIKATWAEYMSKRPEYTKGYYGAAPRFGNDQELLPLQAADFWAWWVREWFEQGPNRAAAKIDECDFGLWRGTRRFPKAVISFNEDEIVSAMISILREMLEPGRLIYDVRFSGPS